MEAAGRLALPRIKTYYKDILIKTVWYILKRIK